MARRLLGAAVWLCLFLSCASAHDVYSGWTNLKGEGCCSGSDCTHLEEVEERSTNRQAEVFVGFKSEEKCESALKRDPGAKHGKAMSCHRELPSAWGPDRRRSGPQGSARFQ